MPTSTPLFPFGRCVATPAALDGLHRQRPPATPHQLLARHGTGDWGELDPEDAAANNYAVHHGERLLSSYRLADSTIVWIITEADRSATTVLLPEDY